MSVKSSAKPIIRRRRDESTRDFNVPTLLIVPDLRSEEQDSISDIPAHGQLDDIGPDSIDDIDVLTMGDDRSLESDENENSLSVDLNQPRTEFGIAPPKNVIGMDSAEALDDLADDFDASLSEAPVEETKRSRKNKTKRPEVFAADTAKTTLGLEMFSKNLQKHLSTVGTIAAAIIACTVVARAMKTDNGVRDAELASTPTELIDGEAGEAEILQTKVIAEATPQFDPTDLRASVGVASNPSPFDRPVEQGLRPNPNFQSSSIQLQAGAGERVARAGVTQPGTSNEEGKVDPFAFPAFAAQESQTDPRSQGLGQPNFSEPTYTQPTQIQQTEQPRGQQPGFQQPGPAFAAPQNSVQRSDFSSSGQVPNNGNAGFGMNAQQNSQQNSVAPPLPAVPNRFSQGDVAAYPTTSQSYQPFNQIEAASEQFRQDNAGAGQGGYQGTPQTGQAFNNNSGVIR